MISMADPRYLLSYLTAFCERRTIKFDPAVFLVSAYPWILHFSAGQHINLPGGKEAKVSTLLLTRLTRATSPSRPMLDCPCRRPTVNPPRYLSCSDSSTRLRVRHLRASASVPHPPSTLEKDPRMVTTPATTFKELPLGDALLKRVTTHGSLPTFIVRFHWDPCIEHGARYYGTENHDTTANRHHQAQNASARQA